ncbi:MAG: DUF2007 domain-containing protein [Lewinellaceae bacterium]|nr:DUF2007 domain-containing protein [Lewinella sp.]MCB9278726.1 DUF2007 domain-containing protein [Lewinellaceae bacterium]
MKEGWVKIFSAANLIQAKLAEDLLKQNGIESHITNKPDSVMPFLGSADLYTTAEDAEAALKVLEENKVLEDEDE